MDDLITWLRAQLDEDERVAKGLAGATRFVGRSPDFYGTGGPAAESYWKHFNPDRVLAEVEAKRRILDVVLAYEATIDGEWGCCHGAEEIAEGRCEEHPPNEIDAVRLLAQPYAGRPGWREEWRA